MWLWLCVLVPVASAYAPLFHYSLSVPVPGVPVSAGVALLHEPERWAGGAGLLIGVPPFRIRKVSAPLVSDEECMVHFEAEIPCNNGQRYDVKSVRCVARGPMECRLRIEDPYKFCDPTHVDVRVVPFSTKAVGLLVVADITTDVVIPEEAFDGIRRNLALCLRTCNAPVARDGGLDLYRQHIREYVI